MAKTIEQLKAQGAEVKNATVVGENTATRVGTLFTDIVEHVEQYEAGQTADTEKNTSAINQEAQERAKADEQLNTAIESEKNRAQEAEKAIIFDVSVNNDGAVFESLQALLRSPDLSTIIPTSVRHGGMTIRFIQGSEQSSDNKYVQYRLMSDTFNTTPSNWQGVDDEPTAGSENLVKSGGVSTEFSSDRLFIGKTVKVFTNGNINMTGEIVISSSKLVSIELNGGWYVRLKSGYIVNSVFEYTTEASNYYSIPGTSEYSYKGNEKTRFTIKKSDNTDISPDDDFLDTFRIDSSLFARLNKVNDDIKDVLRKEEQIEKQIGVYSVTLKSGQINGSNGNIIDVSNRLYSIGFLAGRLTIKTNDGYSIRYVAKYNPFDDSFIGIVNVLSTSFTITDTNKYKLVLQREDNEDISPEEDVIKSIISDNSIPSSIDKLNQSLSFDNKPNSPFTPQYTEENKVITAALNIQDNTGYKLTSVIQLQPQDILDIHGAASTSVSLITLVDGNGNPIESLMLGKDGTNELDYQYIADKEIFVRVSFRNFETRTIIVNSRSIGNAPADIHMNVNSIIAGVSWNAEIKPSFENGNFVNISGAKSANSSYSISDVIRLDRNDVLQVNCRASNIVSVIAEVIDDSKYRNIFAGEGIYKKYYYRASAPIDIVISKNDLYDCRIAIAKTDNSVEICEKEYFDIPLNPIKETPGFAALFTSVGVVGDSLSSGAHNYKKNGVVTPGPNNYEFSWAQYMARLCGTDVYNLSTSGANAKTWCQDISSERGWGYAQNHPFDTYIIALGVNATSLTDVGNLDIDVDMDDYNNNADTFAGWMAGIIQRLKTVRPKAKFFVVTDPRANNPEFKDREQRLAQAEVVRQLAVKFDNVFVIDLLRYGYRVDKQFMQSGFWLYSHGTAAGYLLSAYTIMSYIDWIVRHNLKSFNDLAFIRNPNIAKDGDDVIWIGE